LTRELVCAEEGGAVRPSGQVEGTDNHQSVLSGSGL